MAMLGRHPRFPFAAYGLAEEVLKMSQRQHGRHVSGRELSETLREFALLKFGKHAKAALAELKIFKTGDFGDIIFELIDEGLLMKRPKDSLGDFDNVFDFEEAFPTD